MEQFGVLDSLVCKVQVIQEEYKKLHQTFQILDEIKQLDKLSDDIYGAVMKGEPADNLYKNMIEQLTSLRDKINAASSGGASFFKHSSVSVLISEALQDSPSERPIPHLARPSRL